MQQGPKGKLDRRAILVPRAILVRKDRRVCQDYRASRAIPVPRGLKVYPDPRV